MLSSFQADLILICHFLFILFVVLGGTLTFISKKFAILHIPAAAWRISNEFFGWICPLTPLENRLREKGNHSGYEGSFIEHYLMPVIYPDGLTRNIQFILGAIVLIMNIIIYTAVIVKSRKS